jgi:hypothetical protein
VDKYTTSLFPHIVCPELAEGGATDATLQALTGHMSRRMLEHYSHVRVAAKRDAVAKLESGLMEHSSESAEELTSKAVN